MDTQTRHALQQGDAFAATTQTGLDWVAANRGKVLRIAILILALILVLIAAAVIYNQRKAAAANAFGEAMSTYGTPIADPAQPAPPGMKTFSSAAERAKAANPQFMDVANKFGSFESGENARYFAGITYSDMGQTAQAETELRKAADGHNSNLASLAKLALANLLAQSGRTSDAVKLYQELINKPTTAVPAGTAQLQLAAMYEATNPAEATKLYTSLKDKNKNSPIGEIAAQKLAGGK